MMGSENTELPPGHRFNPFECELIEFYLKPKVLGQKLLSNVVEEKQLYDSNANPWQIFNPQTHPWILSEVSVGKFEKVAYVFVNLTKKAVKKLKSNGGREKFIKKAGCGTWDGQTKRTEIRDFNGDLIGERRMLVFEINDQLEDDFSRLGHWRMHEYSLCGVNKDIPNPANTVLCKITLDSSKCPAIKLHPIKTIHPIKATISHKINNKDTQKVDDNVCSSSITNCDLTTTQSCCVGGFVTIDCSGSKGEEKVDANVCSSSITNCNVTTQSCCDGGLVIDCYGSKGEEDWCYEIDDDWINSLLASEQGEGVSFECPSYPDQLVDDFTTNLGKRKLNVETSYEMMRSLMALFSPKLKDT